MTSRSHRAAAVLVAVVGIAAAILFAASARADDLNAAWAALREGGHVALMRHASAPGTGDPPGFDLEDCATQRNLSAAGRAEAQAIGAAFRSRNVDVDGIYSSQWCRCLETAELLDLGPVTPFAPINSFFNRLERKAPQMAALRDWLSEHREDETAVLVTHQVVVTALSDIFPRSGEIVVAKPLADGRVQVIGRIPPPK